MTVTGDYDTCEKFINLKIKMTQVDFLSSNHSNDVLSSFTTSQRQYFGRKFTSYKSGTLQKDITILRDKKRQFTSIETKLVDYVEIIV